MHYPILFGSLTTVAVFSPLIFATYQVRALFGGLAVSVTAMITCSILYSLVFMPALLSVFDSAGPRHEAGAVKTPGVSVKLIRYVFRIFHRARFVVLPLLVLALAATFFWALRLNYTTTSTPSDMTLQFSVEYDSGINLEYIGRTSRLLEQKLDSFRGVNKISLRCEREKAHFSVELAGHSDKKKLTEFLERNIYIIDNAFIHLPAQASNRESVQIVLTGENNGTLRQLAKDVGKAIIHGKTADSVVYHFKKALPSREGVIDTTNAALQKVNPMTVYNSLYWAVTGPVASKQITAFESDIRVSTDKSTVSTIEEINQLLIKTGNDNKIPVKNLLDWRPKQEAGRIYHNNGVRSVSLSATFDKQKTQTVLQKLRRFLTTYDFPQNYRGMLAPQIRENSRFVQSVGLTLVLAVLLVFIILVFQFQSLVKPAIIFITISFSFLLPMAIVILRGNIVEMPVLIGLIMTAGISVNNSILILDSIKARQYSLDELVNAAASKAVSIITASLTTILGILPLLFAGTSSVLGELSMSIAAGVFGNIIVLILFLPAVATADCKNKTA